MTIPMSDPYTHSFAQQGWQCPVCQTVHAPYMPTCTRCSPVVVTRLANVTVTEPPADDPKETTT